MVTKHKGGKKKNLYTRIHIYVYTCTYMCMCICVHERERKEWWYTSLNTHRILWLSLDYRSPGIQPYRDAREIPSSRLFPHTDAGYAVIENYARTAGESHSVCGSVRLTLDGCCASEVPPPRLFCFRRVSLSFFSHHTLPLPGVSFRDDDNLYIGGSRSVDIVFALS